MWILTKDSNPIGLFYTESQAKATTGEGDHFLIPVKTGRLYDSLIDTGLPGAITYKKVNPDLEGLTAEINDLKAQLTEKENHLTILEERVTEKENQIMILEDRVAVIESKDKDAVKEEV